MQTCKVLLLCFIVVISTSLCFGQNDSVNYRLVLVGDAGELTNGRNPELELLRSVYDLNQGPTSLIFLGDNIYPQGLAAEHAKDYETGRKILETQISVVNGTSAKAFFIPGNHDWKNGKKDGWAQLMHQFRYVRSLQRDNVQFFPEDGCPGPTEIHLSSKVTLVIVDTQWWLHPFDKPGLQSDCNCKTMDDVVTSLKDIVYRNRDKLLLFAAHHPFKTYGIHGGYFTLKQHIFPLTDVNPGLFIPLPLIGSIYPIARGVFGNIQDTRHPQYRRMVSYMDDILKTHPYCIRVSGHDHTLQWIRDKDQNYIVSGAGSKTNRVEDGPLARFVAAKTGFAVLELLQNGKIWVKFFSSRNAMPGNPLFADTLRAFQPVPAVDTVVTFRSFPDSMRISGAPYFTAGPVKAFFFGKNYRREWAEPVRVPVLDIATEKGGLKPLQMGGGKQSKSLRLEAADGNQYVLRSVEKSPEKAIPEEFRKTFVKDVLKDGISASYPYSALSVPALASRSGVPHATPKLVFMPDDPRLGIYRKEFANTLNLLEEREPGGFVKTVSTDKLFEKLEEDNDNHVNEQAVLKARLLDLFIMDFDRHEDQWRWGLVESSKEKVYYPIPRDRDQAFFTNDGVVPFIAKMRWLVPQIQGLRAHSRNIKGFNMAARNFDRSFLTSLTGEDWTREAQELVSRMDDSTIEKALQAQPANVYGYSGEKIITTLKERRIYLVQEALRYYKFLAKMVAITGTDKREFFDVTAGGDGSIRVKVYKINKEGLNGKKLFERNFLRGETKELRLFGLGGDDVFQVRSERKQKIVLRIIGGEGMDRFVYSGPASNRSKRIIYDLKSQGNVFEMNDGVKKALSNDPGVNGLDRKGFKYDVLVPMISANYNLDDRLFLGASLKYTKQGFRKSPYKSAYQVSVNHALATNAYNFGFRLEEIDVIGKTDLVLLGNVKAPNNTINFFRYGNETAYIKGKSEGIRYYRARFNLAEAALLFRVNAGASVSLATGPSFQYFSMDPAENKGRLISLPVLNGLDSASLFKTKTYAGLVVNAAVDNRDNKVVPGRGVNWRTTLQVNKGLNDRSSNYSQLNSDFSLFMSFDLPARVVLATRLGGGINFGHYEFFQSQYLSGTENLRGYRKYRFAGDRILYSNTELRVKLADLNTYLFPGALGLLGFFDTGRVWVKNESSSKWHKGYGGGIWLSPLSKFVITGSLAGSEEGALPLVTFGFQF